MDCKLHNWQLFRKTERQKNRKAERQLGSMIAAYLHRLRLCTLCVFAFFAPLCSFSQSIDRIEAAAGFRLSLYTVQPYANTRDTSEAYSSYYELNLNLGKEVWNERFMLYSGLSFAREQLGYLPQTKLSELPNYQSQYDSVMVNHFRMWNYQIGIPLKLEYRLVEETSFGFIPFTPTIDVYLGLMNTFAIKKGYKEVILVINPNTPYTEEFENEAIKKDVSNFYANTIGNYNLISQAGFNVSNQFANTSVGLTIGYNYFLYSNFNQLNPSQRFSLDLKLFLRYEL
jgi:hypothetical protein